MIRIKKAHYTSFGVADLNQSKDFYGRILRLETIDRPPFRFDGAWYGIGPYQNSSDGAGQIGIASQGPPEDGSAPVTGHPSGA